MKRVLKWQIEILVTAILLSTSIFAVSNVQVHVSSIPSGGVYSTSIATLKASAAQSIAASSDSDQYFFVGSTGGGFPMNSVTWIPDLSVTASYSGNLAISIGHSSSNYGSYYSQAGNYGIAVVGISGLLTYHSYTAKDSSGTDIALNFATSTGDLIVIVIGGEGTGNIALTGVSAQILEDQTYSEGGGGVLASVAIYSASLPTGQYSAQISSTTNPSNAGTSIGAVAYVFSASTSLASNQLPLTQTLPGAQSSITQGMTQRACDTCDFLVSWGSSGTGNGQFNGPEGVAVDSSGNVYVADSFSNRVEKFTSTGVYITQWGCSTPNPSPPACNAGSGNGQFNNPPDVAVDASGNVYVTDYFNNRVQKFTSAGIYITQWGSPGSGIGQFNGPHGIAVDSSGNVYVAEEGGNRVQVFTSAGTYLSQFGSFGSGNGQFDHAEGIVVDASGNVYVTDRFNNRVEKFTNTGRYLTQWGVNGSANSLSFVALDASGNVYVADGDNGLGPPLHGGGHRIVKFTATGTFVTQWGSFGTGKGQFFNPYGVAIDASGNVYVADTVNNNVQKFGPSVQLPVTQPLTQTITSNQQPITQTQSATQTLTQTRTVAPSVFGIGMTSSMLIYTAIGIVALILVVSIFFALRRRGRKATLSPAYPKMMTPDTTEKLQRLKRMLDLGLITQEDYEDQKKRIIAG